MERIWRSGQWERGTPIFWKNYKNRKINQMFQVSIQSDCRKSTKSRTKNFWGPVYGAFPRIYLMNNENIKYVKFHCKPTVKADRHEATLSRNYCMQPCNATYAMSNHDVQRLHDKRCTPWLRGQAAPCFSAFRVRMNIIFFFCFNVRIIMYGLNPKNK